MNYDKVKSDLAAAILGGLTVTVEFDGETYRANSLNVKAEDLYTRYGTRDGYRQSVKLVADDLPREPETGERLKVNGVERKVMGVQVNPPSIIIDLAELYGG